MNKGQSKVLWFVDLIFTDLGLLIVPYGQASPPNTMGAAMQFGILGALLSASAASGQFKTAAERYDLKAAGTADRTPVELFGYGTHFIVNGARYFFKVLLDPGFERGGAEFLPGDELGPFFGVEEKKSVRVEVSFRGTSYRFAPFQQSEDTKCVNICNAFDRLEPWRLEVTAARRSRSDGPELPGVGSLVEWAQRPQGSLPRWVAETVDRLVDEIDERRAPLAPQSGFPGLPPWIGP